VAGNSMCTVLVSALPDNLAVKQTIPMLQCDCVLASCVLCRASRAEVGTTDVSSDPLLPRRVRPATASSGGRPGAGPAMAMAAPRGGGTPDKCVTLSNEPLSLFSH
jgi:hypothetical protein